MHIPYGGYLNDPAGGMASQAGPSSGKVQNENGALR